MLADLSLALAAIDIARFPTLRTRESVPSGVESVKYEAVRKEEGMEFTVSQDDRVRRIIQDPARYFAEARARATRDVKAEMERERRNESGHARKTSRR